MLNHGSIVRVQLNDDCKAAAMRIFRQQTVKSPEVSVVLLLQLLQEDPQLRQALQNGLYERLRAMGDATLTQDEWSVIINRKAELQTLQVFTLDCALV